MRIAKIIKIGVNKRATYATLNTIKKLLSNTFVFHTMWFRHL